MIRAIMATGAEWNVVPYGTEALGVLRIEKGHVTGNEMNGTTTAGDLGLGRMMSNKKDFIARVLATRPASVTDQSDAYVVRRLLGPGVFETLAKLVQIDVHPRAFKTGDVASTVAAHIGTIIWRLDDDVEGKPVFEIAVFRSWSESFIHL